MRSDLPSARQQKYLLAIAAPPRRFSTNTPIFQKKPDLSAEHGSRTEARTSYEVVVHISGQAGRGVEHSPHQDGCSPPSQPPQPPTPSGVPSPRPVPPQGAAWGQRDSEQSRTEPCSFKTETLQNPLFRTKIFPCLKIYEQRLSITFANSFTFLTVSLRVINV